MQQTNDSQIQARVRLLLARKWVDMRQLTIGTTNGVVYLGGGLKLNGAGPRDDGYRGGNCMRIGPITVCED